MALDIDLGSFFSENPPSSNRINTPTASARRCFWGGSAADSAFAEVVLLSLDRHNWLLVLCAS